jgi:hypothetical protein
MNVLGLEVERQLPLTMRVRSSKSSINLASNSAFWRMEAKAASLRADIPVFLPSLDCRRTGFRECGVRARALRGTRPWRARPPTIGLRCPEAPVRPAACRDIEGRSHHADGPALFADNGCAGEEPDHLRLGRRARNSTSSGASSSRARRMASSTERTSSSWTSALNPAVGK